MKEAAFRPRVSTREMKYILVLLSISMLGMSGMNISPALQSLSEAFPDVPSETIQTLVTLPSLFIVFASFLSEPLSRLISVKGVILFGSALFTAAGTAPFFFPGSFEAIRVSRILIGVGVGVMTPLGTTLLFSLFPDSNKRNTVIGWQSCASALGNVFATSIVGALVSAGSCWPFLVHLMGGITILAAVLFLPRDVTVVSKEEEAPSVEPHVVMGVHRWRLIGWYAVMFAFMGYINAFSTKISIYVKSFNIGASVVSTLGISLLTVGSFVGGMFYGQISRFLKKYTVGLGMGSAALGLYLMYAAGGPALVYMSSVLTGLGLAMVTPGILVGVVTSARKQTRTLAVAVNTAASNLGLSFSPYLTAYTTILFFGQGKTVREEYLISAAVLFIMGAAGILIAILAGRGRGEKDL